VLLEGGHSATRCRPGARAPHALLDRAGRAAPRGPRHRPPVPAARAAACPSPRHQLPGRPRPPDARATGAPGHAMAARLTLSPTEPANVSMLSSERDRRRGAAGRTSGARPGHAHGCAMGAAGAAAAAPAAEDKPSARRLYRSHVLQVAAQCLLVEDVCGVRPPYGVVVLAGGRQERVEFTGDLERLAVKTMADMRALLCTGSEPGAVWHGGKCGGCGFRETCWAPKRID